MALNAPSGLDGQVTEKGFGEVDDEWRAMLDRLPGEQVWVELERGRDEGRTEKVSAIIDLI